VPAAGIQAPERPPPAALVRACADCRDRHASSIGGAGHTGNRGEHGGDRGFPAPLAAP
jgi:hypothetical protein